MVLPPILICLVVGCGSNKNTNRGALSSHVASSKSPEAFHPALPISQGLDPSLEQVINWNPAVDRELMRLASFLEMNIEDRQTQSDFSAPNLNFAGMDRENAAKTFSGERTQVTRWRRSNESPGYLDGGLSKLVTNLYGPWESASSFRTQLTAHEISREEDFLQVQVVARSTGTTAQNVGLESTSMWRTKWRITSDHSDELELVQVQVLAHEVIEIESTKGTLFKDATFNILGSDSGVSEQLNFGLDDWAKWIPGLDIMGHHGIAVGDPNNDGLEDIYLCQPEGLPNVLLTQKPDGTAEDLASKTNTHLLDESRAALFVDLDNDGDEDLVISTKQELILLSNNGNGEFQLEHRMHNVYDGGSISASDFDEDGDLDLYVCRYHPMLHEADLFSVPNDYVNATNGGSNILLRNNEGWSFEDVTEQVGLHKENNRFTRCGLWCDFDQDGDQDLFVANQFSQDQLYENENGQFALLDSNDALTDAASSRSASVGDFNSDGRLDFFVASEALWEAKRLKHQMVPNANHLTTSFFDSTTHESRVLYAPSDQEQPFSSYRLPSPIFASQVTYGSVCIDVNNDGFEDVVLTNGLISRNQNSKDSTLESSWIQQMFSDHSLVHSENQTEKQRFATATRILGDEIRNGESFGEQQRNLCFLGLGPIGFANFSSMAGVDFPDDGRGVAALDWDQDGDLDLVMNSRSAPQLRILINQLESKNQFLRIRLTGTQSNRDAIGARIELFLENRTSPLIKSVTAGSGALSQSSKEIHFGFPQDCKIRKLVIHWPSRTSQTFRDLAPNSRYAITEGQDTPTQPRARFQTHLTRQIEPVSSDSLQHSQSIFYPPQGLPNLQFQIGPESWIPLQPMNQQPVFAAFVDDSPASKNLLREIAREASQFEKAKMGVVAIKVSNGSTNPVGQFDSFKTMIERVDFPFQFGTTSQSMLDKMERLYGSWYSDQQLPSPPFAWLIDRDGLVRVAYSSENVKANQAIADLTMIMGGLKSMSRRASPRSGVWMGSMPVINYSRIALRFLELGYDGDEEKFALHSRPYLAIQLCRSAMELKSHGNIIDAKSEFAKALELDPQCERAFLEFGQLLLEQSTNESDEIVRLSLLNEAELLFEKAIELDPANPRAVLGHAEVSKKRNQIDQAIDQLKRFLKIRPNHWDVHAELGRLYFEKREYTKSTSHLLKAYTHRPTLPFVAGDLGFLYLNGGLYEEARSLLKVANQLQPSDVNLKLNFAQAELLTGRYDASARLLREITDEYPERTMPNSLLAWLLATSPSENLRDGNESLALASALLKTHDQLASSHEICAAAYAEIEDFENAIMLQQKAISLMESETIQEAYSKPQLEGLRARLDLYQKKLPYRIDDIRMIPIRLPGT